ncbi:MAG: YadA-like family protein, partial [Acidaminococcaceae bacterium]|nr:YadA-like family protein [Acidaminococcaceae bacterium]
GDESHSVTGAQTNKVDGNVTNTYGADVTTDITGNQSTTVGGNAETEIAGTSTTTVTGLTTENYNGGLTTAVDGDESHSVTGAQTNKVDGAVTNTYGNTVTTTVTGLATENYNGGLKTNVTGNQTTTATGDISNSAANISNTATTQISNTVGGSSIVMNDSQINIDATKTIFNEGQTNQIQIDTTGIRIGLNSGQVDDEGFYAGGHTWDEAKAAIGADGRIKGLYAEITNDLTVGGDVTVGGTLTTEKLVVNDTFQAQAFAVNGKTYIDSNGLNANNQKITNVAPGDIGPNSTDAVNGSQLYNIREDLSKDIKKVGAGAAAMANLRPVESGNKFSLALGVGTYRSETAAAIGMFYKPTDRIQFNLSGTVGSGHNMFGGGISFALDKVVKPVGNAAANAEIKSLQAENAEIKAQLEELKAVVESMKTAAK